MFGTGGWIPAARRTKRFHNGDPSPLVAILGAMSFGRKHPEPVQAAVGEAALRGLKVPAIVRALSTGKLPGYPEPYELPVESARYYAKTAIAKAAASTITTRAAGDPSRAIDYLARQALSEAEIGLHEVRAAKTRDPEAVARWVNVLKVIAPLLRPEDPDVGKGKTKRDKTPKDPLTARLTSPASPSLPSLEEVAKEGLREPIADNDSLPTTNQPQDQDHAPLGGVPAQPAETSPSWA